MQISLGNFTPVNQWIPDDAATTWKDSDERALLIDQTTGNRYLNISEKTLLACSAIVVVVSPIIEAIGVVANVIDFASFTIYWIKGEDANTENYFIAKIINVGIRLLKIAAAPISFVALELAAIYGLFRPYDGRKMYEIITRVTTVNFSSTDNDYVEIVQGDNTRNNVLYYLFMGVMSFISQPLPPLHSRNKETGDTKTV